MSPSWFRNLFQIRLGLVLAIAALFSCEIGVAAEKTRILMLTQSAGFMHGSVRRGEKKLAPAEIAMIQLGQTTGEFEVTCTQDAAADFTPDNLARYDIVMLYTTGDLPIPDETLNWFLNDWLKQKGHGLIGVHSSSDTYREKEAYWDMIGGTFNGHPWGAGTTVTINVHEPDNPMMASFGSSFEIRDEIYQYRHWQPEKVRVLMSLDMSKCQPSKPYHVPVSWVKAWGEGRIYYNNLGHNESSWADKRFLDSLRASVLWIRGDTDTPTQPNPELSAEQEAVAKAAAGE